MLYFISGAVRSGKSTFAENLICEDKQSKRIYIATSKYDGEEMKQRISKHKNDRKYKQFETFELPHTISKILNKIDSNTNVLIECLTNLVANEMFDNNLSLNECENKITNDILKINEKSKNTIIVSNDLYGDDLKYSDLIEQYKKCLCKISINIVNKSDKVYEIFNNINLLRKGL